MTVTPLQAVVAYSDDAYDFRRVLPKYIDNAFDILGNSIDANNYIFTGVTNGYPTFQNYASEGYFTWAKQALKGQIYCLNYLGLGGDRVYKYNGSVSAFVDRLPTVLASRAANVIIGDATNDLYAAPLQALADIKAAYLSLWAPILAIGKRVFQRLEPAHAFSTSGQRNDHLSLNRWIINQARITPGLFVFDCFSPTVDPTSTNAAPLANMLYDSVTHPNNLASQRCGQGSTALTALGISSLASVIQAAGILPTGSRLPLSQAELNIADVHNLVLNPLNLGTPAAVPTAAQITAAGGGGAAATAIVGVSGVLPPNFSIVRTGSSIVTTTCVCSVEAQADGTNAIVLSITGDATETGATFSVYSNDFAGSFPANGTAYAAVEMSANLKGDQNSAPLNLQFVAVQTTINAGGTTSTADHGRNSQTAVGIQAFSRHVLEPPLNVIQPGTRNVAQLRTYATVVANTNAEIRIYKSLAGYVASP